MKDAWKAAAVAGDAAALERQLDAGADPNARDEHGETALMIAAVMGRTAAVRLLIDRGALLDCTAKYNMTALMLAALNGRAEIARALVDAGADRSVRARGAPGFFDKTALDLAEAAYPEIASMLRQS